jgi:glucokinase
VSRSIDAVAAVDIGATKTSIVVLSYPFIDWPPQSAPGTVRVRTIPTDPRPAVTLDAVLDAVRAGLADLAPAGRARLLAIGCAAPGPLDPGRGIVTHSPNLGWRDVAIGAPLGSALGVPWRLDDDANLGALGEARLGAGRGERIVAYLTVSSGIGAGLAVDGVRVSGAHDLAGEVGHLVAEMATGSDVPRCGCGRLGHLEAYASGNGLVARAARRWPEGRLPDGRPAPRGADAILRAARREPAVRTLVREAEVALGQAIAAIAAVLDPDVIVMGGAVALAHPGYVRRAAAVAARRTLPATARVLRVVPAALGPDSVLAGAAIAAADLLSNGPAR